MKLLLLGLACVLFFIYVEAGFSFGRSKDATYRNRVSDIKKKLRNRNMKANDVLNDTNIDLEDIEDDDTLFDAAAEEFEVTVRNTTDKKRKRGFFNRTLGRIQNLTQKHRNANFGFNQFAFMDEEDVKKVRQLFTYSDKIKDYKVFQSPSQDSINVLKYFCEHIHLLL